MDHKNTTNPLETFQKNLEVSTSNETGTRIREPNGMVANSCIINCKKIKTDVMTS